ncbi:MAG: hypothetical protein II114_09995, partial [Treponema sp.]|nr:hypothetical protein [Treponema sp.]
DTFYFYSDGPLNDKDGKNLHPIGNLPKGSSSSTRTLDELKKNKYFFQVGGRAEGFFNCTFTLVLSELPSATFSFTPALNGLFDGADYECVEVNNAADTVFYTISCLESGVSLSGTVDGSSFSGTKTGTLGLGTHTLVAKTAASGSGNSTVTRKINVVQKLQEPVIKFYKESSHTNEIASTNDNAESDMKYKLYSNYNIDLDEDGNGQLYYAVSAGSGTTVTVEETTINGDEETITEITSGSLPLGPHILTFTVSKDGNTPVSVEKKVYVQGILSEPVITSSNGTFVSGSGGIKDNKVDSMVWKFSYLNYDSLKCKVNPGNKDNDVALYGVLNGKDVSLGDPTKNIGIEADNAYQLKIVQKRQYCKTLTTTKYVKGIIKPITLTYSNNSNSTKAYMCISRYDGKGKFNVLGTIYVNGATIWGWGQQDDRNNISAQSWADLGYGKAKDGKTENAVRSVSVTCTSPDDDVTILAENMRRRNGSAMGDKSQSRTLSEIKSTTEIPASCGAEERTVPGWTLWSGELTDNTHYVYIYVTFVATESES